MALEMALQQRAIGRRIAQLRERARLTQEAAADRVGVTLRAYQKWEAGGGIQYGNLEKLASIYDTTVDDIVGNYDGGTPDPFRAKSQLDEVAERLVGIESKLDRQYLILGDILAALAAPDTQREAALELMSKAGRALADLGRERQAARSESPATPRVSRGRPAGG